MQGDAEASLVVAVSRGRNQGRDYELQLATSGSPAMSCEADDGFPKEDTRGIPSLDCRKPSEILEDR